MGAGWWAKGLLFENCNCAVICPGHVHFSQDCTNETCIGYWAVRFDGGQIDGVDLGGAKAVVAFRSPRKMIEGGWSQVIVLNSEDDEIVREKVESLFKGELGGPWGVLARFVAHRLETIHRQIVIEDLGTVKKVRVEGLLTAEVEAIKGKEKGKPVTLENMFNQIHAPSQVIARGSSLFNDPDMFFKNESTHALYSDFDWRVTS